jgi:adenosylcobinamide-phosphate synthase
MFLTDFSPLVDSVLIFFSAFLIDSVFGEFPDRIHPTVWMGKVIAYLKPRLRSANGAIEKINGVLLGLLVIMLFAVPAYVLLFWVRQFLGWAPYIIASAIVLKTTFAVKCMKQYTLPIADALKKGDIGKARQRLPYIVRREPAKLNERQIISAAVESIAESITDGITSPFLYFALLGVPGAVAFRVISTLDSMVGYKDREHVNVGWFSACMDTIANYVPVRLSAVLMVVSALLLGENWRESWRILQRDKKKTASLNAGWTLSTMAGALNIQLEKTGYYILGDDNGISPMHLARALRIMELTAILFSIVIVFPLLILKALIIR